MKLKDILPALERINKCTIIFIEDDEEFFSGYVMDIPWWIADYKLSIDSEGEAITLGINEKGEPYFIIYITEN